MRRKVAKTNTHVMANIVMILYLTELSKGSHS